MKNNVSIRFHQLELFGILTLFFSITTMESVKNIAFVLFLIGAVGYRLTAPHAKFQKPKTFETLLIASVFVSLASTLINWPIPKGFSGLRDTISYTFLAYIMYQNHYTKKEEKWMIYTLMAGLLTGLAWSWWNYHSGAINVLELNAIAGVNRTACFTGIAIIAMVGMLIDTHSTFNLKSKIFISMVLLLSTSSFLIMGSRGVTLGCTITFIILTFKYFRFKSFKILMVIMCIAISALLWLSLNHFEHHFNISRLKHIASTKLTLSPEKLNKSDRVRFDYWQVGVAQIFQGDHKLFGLGPRNFTSTPVDRLKLKWPMTRKTKKIMKNKPLHSHNFLLTKWAEEGFLGFAVFAALLIYIATTLFKALLKRTNEISWYIPAGIGAFVIPVSLCMFDAAFRRDLAWLSMTFIGLCLGKLKNPNEENKLI